MSKSIKTRELYFSSRNVSFADNTTGSMTPILVTIPETSPVFRSVVAEVYVDDNATTAVNIGKRALTFQLGTTSVFHRSNTSTVTNTLEAISIQHQYNLTPYFTSNWSGTSMGATASFVHQGTAQGYSNLGCRLIMTYEYDDNSATQAKTVFIPISQRHAFLANTKTQVGIIPILDSYLPETGKTINQINFIFESNKTSVTSSNDSSSFEIDSSGVHTSFAYANSTGVSRLHKYIWSGSSFTTNQTHSFNLWNSHLNALHPNTSVIAAVDYSYSPTSPSILNSVRIPFHFNQFYDVSLAETPAIETIEYLVNEPDGIVGAISSIMLYHSRTATAASLFLGISTSSIITYTSSTSIPSLSSNAGSHIIPLTSSNGFNIKPGYNKWNLSYYRNAVAGFGGGVSGLIYLNYRSGNGDVNRHNKTIINGFVTNDATASANNVQTKDVIVAWMPEATASYYYLNSIGIENNFLCNPLTTPSSYHLSFTGSVVEGVRIKTILPPYLMDVAEIGNRKFYASIKDIFKKTYDGPTELLRPTQSREMVMTNTTQTVLHRNQSAYYTYNSNRYTISGSISNSTGGPITLYLYNNRVQTGSLIATSSRTGNGTYSFTIPDNIDSTYYVVGFSGSVSAASNTGSILNTFDLNFQTGSLPGQEFEVYF